MNPNMAHDFTVRNASPEDHPRIVTVMKDWWGGRDLTHSVPRLFLEHFCDTSFVAEKGEGLVGFLVGFLSQARPAEGYIHFAGIHPQYREQGIGRYLYERFEGICRQNGRSVIRSCTSPVNKASILFHQRIGFTIAPQDTLIDGVPVAMDHNRPGDSKVLFRKSIK